MIDLFILGLFGIGSGMILGPVLLSMSVSPRVSTAISAFMILFTSSSTSLQYALLGMLRLDYALWEFGYGFVGALIGQFAIASLLKVCAISFECIFIL